jgi:uncharacterized Zn-binding protein involved in type VI secretion
MGNININGKTAVHAKSDGQLITTDTCMTPPYCIPINYTNQAESQMADMAASSVKIQGAPACNQKSNFKISKGDAPGACGGTSSGSVGQMAEFIVGSQDVMIEGKPAVRNGDKMVSNLKNTPPQPLQQPPAGNAPVGKVTSPEPTKAYSQLVVLTDDEGYVLANRPYRVWIGDEMIMEGITDKNGATGLLSADAVKNAEIELLQRRV